MILNNSLSYFISNYIIRQNLQMVKIQVDLDDQEDYILDMFRAKNRLKSKQMAVKEIISQFSKKGKS